MAQAQSSGKRWAFHFGGRDHEPQLMRDFGAEPRQWGFRRQGLCYMAFADIMRQLQQAALPQFHNRSQLGSGMQLLRHNRRCYAA